jgi:hypothetical protein
MAIGGKSLQVWCGTSCCSLVVPTMVVAVDRLLTRIIGKAQHVEALSCSTVSKVSFDMRVL